MALKIYEKENQVYKVLEGSELEVQLQADGFNEVKEDSKKATRGAKASKGGKVDELEEIEG